MFGSCLFGVNSSDHLCFVIECLLSLEAALGEFRSTWLPVIPWQMTLVCLLTQTLGAVDVENMWVKTLLSMVNKISKLSIK
jgi:hypothetical protein